MLEAITLNEKCQEKTPKPSKWSNYKQDTIYLPIYLSIMVLRKMRQNCKFKKMASRKLGQFELSQKEVL